MTPAYEEGYLNDSMTEMGDMIDFAVNQLGFDPDAFFMLFISSGVAEKYEHGNPRYVGGMSGNEVALEVVRRTTGRNIDVQADLNPERTTEYWCGWIMAYIQWRTGYSFKSIVTCGMNIAKIQKLYLRFKTGLQKYVDETGKLVKERTSSLETNLKRIRKARKLSQKELADISGVSLRMIQLYEQRQNDINKAQVSTVVDLAQALGCDVTDITETV